jgi:hypothetical protein
MRCIFNEIGVGVGVCVAGDFGVDPLGDVIKMLVGPSAPPMIPMLGLLGLPQADSRSKMQKTAAGYIVLFIYFCTLLFTHVFSLAYYK